MQNPPWRIIVLSLVAPLLMATEASMAKTFPPIALVNRVAFKDPKFNNELAGCAFLVEHQGKLYACTCKHALWAAKSPAMKGVHFEDTLQEWRMERKDNPQDWVRTGRLLNADRQEPIGPENVNADWLIFEIQENHSKVQPLQLRTTPMVAGEPLFAIGWSFKDKEGPQRVYQGRFLKNQGAKILFEEQEASPTRPGMSGGAVVDQDGRLVGIVSDYTKDAETGRPFNSPCSVAYLSQFLAKPTH